MSETASNSRVPKKWLMPIILGAFALIAVIVAVSLFATYQNVKSEGIRRESELSALYLNGENKLSTCVVQTTNSVGLANAQTESLVKVFTTAIGERNQSNDQAVFTALKEAYPDTAGLDKTYQNVLSTINGCRDDYAGAQTRVLQSVKDFKSWKDGSFTTRLFAQSFPDEHLEITIGGTTLTGTEALKKVGTPIVDTVTEQTYQEGTFEATDPFGTDDK